MVASANDGLNYDEDNRLMEWLQSILWRGVKEVVHGGERGKCVPDRRAKCLIPQADVRVVVHAYPNHRCSIAVTCHCVLTVGTRACEITHIENGCWRC